MSLQAHPILGALNILLIALALLAWVSLLVAVLYLVMAIVRWREPHRNRRFIRAALFALVFPCVFVLQQAVIHRVILPTLAREGQQARQRRVDAIAYVKRGEKV